MPGNPTLGSVAGGMADTQLDLQNIQLNQFKLQEAPIQLEAERTQLMRDQISLQQQMKFMQLLQNANFDTSSTSGGASTPSGLAGVMSNLATIQLESGMVDQATKSANAAARLQETSSRVDYRTYKLQTDRMSRFANILDSIPDNPSGWTQALQAMADDPGAMRDQKFQSLMQTPWKPGLIPMLKTSVLTAKEQAEVNYRRAAGEHAEAATVLDKDRRALVSAQTDYYKDRAKKLQKEGGDLRVKARELQAITDKITVDYPEAKGEEARNIAQPLAEEMVQMIQKQGLSLSEAAQRVYSRAKKEGVFAGLHPMTQIAGSTPDKPIPVKAPKKGQPLSQGMTKNLWYVSPERFGDNTPRTIIGTKAYTQAELKQLQSEDDLVMGEDEAEEEDAD